MGNNQRRGLVLGEFLLVAGLLAAFTPGWRGWSRSLSEGESKTIAVRGVAIHDQYDAAKFLPAAWQGDPADCGGAQVDSSEAKRALPVLERFADAYDPAVLHENLTDIYLMGELHCYGKGYGGSNYANSIYVRVGTQAQGYSDEILLAVLHEEFSSILFRRYTFPARQWQAAAGNGFQYRNDWVHALGEGGLEDVLPTHALAHGFLTRYSQTSLENDFNEYAGWLFAWPDRLCKYASQYAAIAHKAKLAAEFYRSIEPGFMTWGCK